MRDRRGVAVFGVALTAALLLGVEAAHAKTYYVDYAGGDDSAAGTSQATAWQRHPYMTGFAGSYTHAPGDDFVFRGGVTWPAAALPLSIAEGGTDADDDTYGTDPSWFAGSAFTRPVFDGEYAVSDTITLGSVAHVTIEGFELEHVTSSSNYGYGLISGYTPSYLTIRDCYLHGWRTSSATDDAHGGVIFGNAIPETPTIVIDHCEVENSENASAWNGVMFRMVGTIRDSRLHDNSSAVLFCLDFDSNELYRISHPGGGFDGAYHTNGVYLSPGTLHQTRGYIRRSVLHDVGGGANMAYPNPSGAEVYVYDNLFYGNISSQGTIEIDPYNFGAGGDDGSVYVYNNTVVPNPGAPAVHVVDRSSAMLRLAVLEMRNNHVIGGGSHDAYSATCASIVDTDDLVQTADEATAQGYVEANLWQPTDSMDGTVDHGFDMSAVFTTDRFGLTRTGAWDIGCYELGNEPPPDGGVVDAGSVDAGAVDTGTMGAGCGCRVGSASREGLGRSALGLAAILSLLATRRTPLPPSGRSRGGRRMSFEDCER